MDSISLVLDPNKCLILNVYDTIRQKYPVIKLTASRNEDGGEVLYELRGYGPNDALLDVQTYIRGYCDAFYDNNGHILNENRNEEQLPC